MEPLLRLLGRAAAWVRAALVLHDPVGLVPASAPLAAGEYRLLFAADGQLQHVDEPFRAWWAAHYGEVPATADQLVAALRRAAPGAAAARRLLPVSLALAGLSASELLALRTPAGRRRVHLRASPVVDPGGRVRGAVAVWRDLGAPPVGGAWVEQTAPRSSPAAN